MTYPVKLHDCHPPSADLRAEVLAGLQKTHKELPCKLFYDDRGSELFERICQLEEYYPTRTESRIMQDHGGEMVDAAGPKCLVVEYGSGSSDKTQILLEQLDDPVAYVPIDISRERLLVSARRLSGDFPGLEVLPVCADYELPFAVPTPTRPVAGRLVFFPGSTIGNFHPSGAVRFLRRMADHAGPGGKMLIGVDLKKDAGILNRAYNDKDGVTAEFNLNILRRINRELGAGFRTAGFRHHAYYNEAAGRVEMHLVSRFRQTIQVDDVEIDFDEGESIWTESAYKYTVDEFAEMAARAGFDLESAWTDDEKLFSVKMYSVGAGRISCG
jgi:dimethylhistidine N-methyltransferase